MSAIFGWDHTQQFPNNPTFVNGAVESAVDWLGNRFRVGDTVIYCIGAGRGQMMAVGEVVQMAAEERKGGRFRYAEPGEEPTRILPWSNEPVVDLDETYYQITVQVLTRKTSGYWDNRARTRPAWVNAMNITSLPLGEL